MNTLTRILPSWIAWLLVTFLLIACTDRQITNTLGGLCRGVDECTHTDPHGDTPGRHGRYKRDL